MLLNCPYDKKSVFAKRLQNRTTDMFDTVFSNVRCDSMNVRCAKTHELNGYGTPPIKTITTQAVDLGIPAFQLELPLSVRKCMAVNDKLIKRLAAGIYAVYEKVV